MEWIDVGNKPKDFEIETRIFVLLKECEENWFHDSYDYRIKKAWWIPQRQIFVVGGVEDAKHLITHWMPLPQPPKGDSDE